MQLYEIASRCLIGGRDDQQDSFGLINNVDTAFAVVCDGMGGLQGGALASKTAVDRIMELYNARSYDSIPRFYIQSAELVNESVYRLKDKNGSLLKCGTTIVSCAVRNNELYWFSAGDSRLYLFRSGRLTQITEDHNYFLVLDEQLKDGKITQEEYRTEQEKGHALISCLGKKKLGRVHMNLKPFMLVSNDMLLLASDGLYKALDSTEIADCLEPDAEKSAQKLERRLSDLDTRRLDNTTYIIIMFYYKKKVQMNMIIYVM